MPAEAAVAYRGPRAWCDGCAPARSAVVVWRYRGDWWRLCRTCWRAAESAAARVSRS